MGQFFTQEERIRRCIAKHPDWTDARIQNSVKGRMELIQAVRAGVSPTLQTGESKPLEGNGNAALVSLDKIIARYDIKGAILRVIGELPKGKLIVEAELCQRTAGSDRNRFRRTVENNQEEFKAFRIKLRLDESAEGKWFWGHVSDIEQAQKIVSL